MDPRTRTVRKDHHGRKGIQDDRHDAGRIDEGERNLLKLASSVGDGMKRPSFLMILTATSIAYRTENGVWVVPLGCLGP